MPEEYPYVYAWKNNPEREKLFGERCRIVTQGERMRTILIEFTDGKRIITSQRSIRRVT